MSNTHPQSAGDREQLLSAILQAVADAILIVDADGIVRYANAASEQIFARPLDEIVEKPFGLPIVSGATTEVDIVHSDGMVLVAELRTVDLMLEGKPGYVASIRDITARKQAIENAHARFLADCANVLSSSLEYAVSVNELAKLCVEDYADWCVIDLIEGNDELKRVAVAQHDPEKNELARALAEIQPEVTPLPHEPEVLRSGEAELVHQFDTSDDAHYRDVIRRISPRSAMIVPLVARRRVLGVMAFITSDSRRSYSNADLATATELGRAAAAAVDNSRLYQEADRGNQAKSNFLAVMSHELRTPLNAVIGYADLLTLGIPKPIPREATRHVDRIRASARHLLDFIDEILTFSRTEAERTLLDVSEISVRDVAVRVASLAEPLARGRGLHFVMELPHPDYTVRTDAAMLQQILLNLLSNAIKFTPRGEVALAVAAVDDWTHFHVRDSGIGIMPEYLDRIFEPFWQAEQSRTRSAEGAGLGLSLAKRLAQALGANLVVQSTAHKGSTFTLQLPNQARARKPARPAEGGVNPGMPRGFDGE